MSAHLVETSEEDSFLAVAKFIGDLLNEGQERTALADTPGSLFTRNCEALLVEGSFGELLSEFAAQIDMLLKRVTDKASLDCCLDVLVHIVPRVPEEEWGAAAAKVSAALTAEVDKQAERRVLVLTDLFNVLPEPRIRFRLLMDTLAYAKQASLAGLVAPTVKAHVEAWAEEWELGPADERALYLAAADVLRASRKKKAGPLDGYRLTLKALATFQGASAAELEGVREAAAGACADFVRLPDQFQFDLLEADAVKQLQGDARHGPLFVLITILLTSANVKDFEAFAKEHSEVLAGVGISPEDALAKARILALLSLASQSNELSFASIKEALDVEEGQEEAWVIRAIGIKLLEARIDQMRQSVSVTKLTQRAFTAAQWAELRAQLAAWKENVWSVKDLVGSHKEDGLSRGVPAAPVALRA